MSNQSQWTSATQAAFSTSEDDIINITASFTLSADGNPIFSNVTVNGNGHTINGADQHSAITISTAAANVTINNLTLTDNKGASGNNGGAILYTIGSSLTLNNVTIRDSASAAASADGGGLYCSAANLTIRNSRIHDNSGGEGGGVYLGNGCTNAQIINSRIYNNTSSGGREGDRTRGGGGIHVAGGADVTISGSRIYSNTAGTGTGITEGGHGGGIYAYASSSSLATVNVNSSSIYNNRGYDRGGGFYMNGRTTLNISGSAIYGNTSHRNGAGLNLGNEPSSPATHTIVNSSIFGNTASTQRGGGIFATMNFQSTTSALNLRHVTITGNTSNLAENVRGDGLYASSVKVTMQNSIISGNFQTGRAASNCIFEAFPAVGHTLGPVLAHNIVGGGSTSGTGGQCTHNADSADPQLESSTSGDPPYYNLRVGSPAIDSADCLSSVTTDQRGRTRPNPASTDGKCDKGAIEWYAPPPPPSRSAGVSGSSATGSSQTTASVASVIAPTALPRASTCLTLEGVWVDGIAQSTECQRVSGVAIGNEEIAASAVDAVDVWGWVLPNTQICFFASGGSFKFIDTGPIPRVVYDLSAYSQNGMTCATIDRAGILVLLPGAAPPPLAASSAAAAQTQTQMLGGCMVTTTALLNFRDAPDGEVTGGLPYDVTLTAMEKSGGWYKVDYHGEQGWISADYVVPKGSCGG